MTLDPEQLRRAMRAWTTGVAVIMAAHDSQSYGMTINSFTSLSLEPPLISVTLRNATHVYALVSKSRTFGLTILSASQRELAEDFAGRKHGAERMAGIQTKLLASGASFLEGGLAWLDCNVIHTYAAGENTLFIAEVTEARVASAENPLVYHNREYHQLA